MFREKIELAFECQAPVQIPIEAAAEAGVVGSTQVGVCKPHGGKLRAKFKACVVVLGKRRQSAKQREQPEESKIAGNQTKHEAAPPLRQARRGKFHFVFQDNGIFGWYTPIFRCNHQAERWAARYSAYAARYRSTSFRSK